jgi:hypothetical protein
VFFIVILHGWIFNWQISFLYFNFIGLMQCSKTLSVISSTDWERIIRAMKLHQYFEFGPSSQDPFSFCHIQLALMTVVIQYSTVQYCAGLWIDMLIYHTMFTCYGHKILFYTVLTVAVSHLHYSTLCLQRQCLV